MDNTFKTNARIVFELGKESIENKTIALSEIIKNSYDADATKCDIIVHKNGEQINLFDKKISSLEIIDNGIGMNDNDLINNWLIIGTNNKKIQKTKINPNSKRIPVGEKGIGRFAVNKIGNKITIITKKENSLTYCLYIDFNNFSENKLLDDIKVKLDVYNGNNGITTKSGTKIIIDDLNEEWSDQDLKNVYSEILKLQSPFRDEDDNFEIAFTVNNEPMFDNIMKVEEILKYSLWQAETMIMPNEKEGKMNFSFTPYEEMKLKGFVPFQTVYAFGYNDTGQKLKKIDISKYKIGPLKIRLYAFHRTPKVLKMLKMKKEILTSYLDENGGVRIYRSGQRVYNYGSKEEDWLGLNLKRLNSPSNNLSKNIIIGIIDLDAQKSSDLVEKTNREGFIENAAFIEFKKMVEVVINNFAYFIYPFKTKIKEIIDKNEKREKIDDTIEELIDEINGIDFLHESDKENIVSKIKNISEEFQSSRKLYLSIASNSIEFNMMFHDIDKHIKNLLTLVRNRDINIKEIRKSVININDLLNAQSDLIRNRDFAKIKTTKLIDKFKNYAYYRLKDHKIEMNIEIEEFEFIGIESQLLRVLINLLDNSIYWLELQKDKKIFLKVKRVIDEIIIYFADNGPGFNVDDPNILFQPFVTRKKNGLGLGLFIVNEIISLHDGKISFDVEDDDIPRLYCGVRYRIELGDRNELKEVH